MEKIRLKRVVASLLMLSFCSFNSAVYAAHQDVGNAEKVTVSGTNGNSGTTDGGIVTNNGGEVTLEGAFENNTTEGTWYGGSVIYSKGGSTIAAESAQFINNSANGVYDHGGAMTVINGMLDIKNNVEFSGNTVANNPNGYGGAIYMENMSGDSANTVTIGNEVIFSENSAASGGAVYIGGANTTFGTNVEFSNNESTKDGGAVMIGSGYADTTVTFGDGAKFSGNKSTGGSGGAIQTGAGGYDLTVNLGSAKFTGNEAAGEGGAIFNSSMGKTSTISTNGATFTKNKADGNGGAIANSVDGVINISGSTFTENEASGPYGGGAIYNRDGALTIADAVVDADTGAVAGVTSFTGNSASSGGAIHNWYGDLEIGDYTEFEKNTGVEAAGAVRISDSSSAVIGDNVKFITNSADYAGALLNQRSSTTIGKDAVFKGNSTTTGSGGAIANEGDNAAASLTIGENAKFIDNISGNSGGAISNYYNDQSGNNYDVSVNIQKGAEFTGNTAAKNGGAISNNAGDVTVTDATFENNSAINGGAVYTSDFSNTESTLTINGGTEFKNNTATGQGGALYAAGDAKINTNGGGVSFSGNTSSTGANDIYIAESGKNGGGAANLSILGSGELSIGSGIAGVADTTITNSGATLALETGSVNSGYAGEYTQTAGTTEINSEFFGGESTISAGNFDLNEGAKLVAGSTVTTANGVTTTVDGNVEVNGTFTDAGTTTIAEAANLAVNGTYDASGATLTNSGNITVAGADDTNKATLALGTYTQNANASLTVDNNATLDLNNNNLTIDNGTVAFKGNGGLASGDVLTISDAVNLEMVERDTVTMNAGGIGVGEGLIAMAADAAFDMNETNTIVAGDILTQNVTVTNADISAETADADLTIGDGADKTTLTLSDNATSQAGLNVAANSELKLAPTEGAELTLTEANNITGAGSITVDEIVEKVAQEDGTTVDVNKGVGTVYIQSDNSGFSGNFLQKMGDVIAQAGSKFFGGANKIEGGSLTIQKDATLGGTSNEVTGGEINLEDGAILANGITAGKDATAGTYGTVNIYNAIEGTEGTDEFAGKTIVDAADAITTGTVNYVNADGSTSQTIIVSGGGLGLFNNTIIRDASGANEISLVADKTAHLILGNGSGIDADQVNVVADTSLTYSDGAYMPEDQTINMTDNGALNFDNENAINYNQSIVSDSQAASINQIGSGSTTIQSSLENYDGSVNVTEGALNLAGGDEVIDLSGISVDGGTLTTGSHVLVNSADESDPYGKVIVTNGGTLNVNNSLEADKLVEITDGSLNVLGSLGTGNNAGSQTAINLNNAIVNIGEDIVTDNIGIHEGSVVNVTGAIDGKDFLADGEGTVVNAGEYLLASEGGIGVKDGATVSAGGEVTASGDVSVTSGSSLSAGGDLTSMTGSVGVDKSTLTVLGDLIAENSTNGTSLSVLNEANLTVNGDVLTNQNVALDKSNLTVNGNVTTEGMVGVDNGSNLTVGGDVDFNNYFVVQNGSTAAVNGDVTGTAADSKISISGKDSTVTLNGDNTNVGNLGLTDGILNNYSNMSIAQNMTIAATDAASGVLPTINMQDGGVNSINVAGNLDQSSNVNMSFDYDPRGNAMDQVVVGGTYTNAGNNEVIITGINFVNSPDNYTFEIDGTNLIVDSTGAGQASIGDSQFVANTALGKYLVTATSSGGGAITGSLQSVNPQMYRAQVSTVAQYANQLAFNNLLFDHSAIVSGQFGNHSDDEVANRYAAANPLFGPYQYSKKDGGLWFKAYGNIENISMTQGIHVDNQAYGAILGADFPVVELKDGWKLIPTAYVAYNGAHQNYDFVSMYQNGGQIGAMATAYKGDFFTSLLAYGGGYANEMNVRNTGFGSGSDTTGNWFAGVASKTAYNFHLPKDFIIQPTAMFAYNIFGNQNYGSQFGGNLGMSTGYLNGINVAPGVNVIWNKKTFSIYGTAQLVFNIMGGVDGQAGNVTLDDVRMKHPYVEYGLGVVKSFKDRLAGYVQFTIRNGGRTGIGFMGGFQYKLGK